MKKKVCMIVQDKMVKGGIAAVISGYYGSKLEQDYEMIYVESYKDGGKLAKLLKGIKGYFHFAKVLLIDHPDLVHIHSSFGPSFYRKLPFIYMASFARVPIINHIHGADFDSFYLSASEKKKKQIRDAYSRCEKLIALSAEWKERLSNIVEEDKVIVIENYSVLNQLALNIRNDRKTNNTVLFLGELGRRKGCYDIPAVMKKVAEQIPSVKFVLAGAGAPDDEAAIRSLISENHVEDNVVFPGWVRGETKEKLLNEADVFFLPSYNEGMPMSILDAMGYGLPIVSTNVGGIPKIVHDGSNGCCCEPGNIERFAAAIVEILKDDVIRHRYAETSYQIVSSQYSLKQHLEKLTVQYDEAIKGNLNRKKG